jgi:hypothetical protein
MEEVDELIFLFGAEANPNMEGLDQVLSVDLDGLGVLGSLAGVGHGEHGRVGQRGRCVEAQLLS